MRVCKTCGRSEGEVEFYRHTRQCRDCALAFMSEYNKKRNADPSYKEKRRERWNKWHKQNKRKRNPEMEKNSKQSSPRRFMTDMVAHLRRQSRKKKIEFDIDLDYVEALWVEQSGRCAITKLSMTYENKDLFGVRIDTIKGSKGYVKDNIQLVCDGIKRMKRDMDNEEVQRFIQEIKSVIII
jgi:hypothetical protein